MIVEVKLVKAKGRKEIKLNNVRTKTGLCKQTFRGHERGNEGKLD